MPLKLMNLQCPVEASEDELPGVIAECIEVQEHEIQHWRILKKSLDARQKHHLRFVYSVIVTLQDESALLQKCSSLKNKACEVSPYQSDVFYNPTPGVDSLENPPVIVGTGPAGLLAGYYLAMRGFRPILIERGAAVKERVPAVRGFDSGGNFQEENNYLFGEGGAGCFSDGKLTCRMSGADVDWVLDQFVKCGGKESLIYEHRPHLGSNRLPLICRNFRRFIEQWGGSYQFNCKLEQLRIEDGSVAGIVTSQGMMKTSQIILAIGHSARDTYEMLYDVGLPMQAKPFQLGLRIEHPQEQINRHKYGTSRYEEVLGAADYHLMAKGSRKKKERDLFTFCMCAGGVVIPSVSEAEHFCTNGMSRSRHDTPFANSGLVVTIDTSEFENDHPLAGVELQRKYESLAFRLAGKDYRCPIQSVDDFLHHKTPSRSRTYECSYERGVEPLSLEQLLPPQIVNAIKRGLPVMNAKWKGDYLPNALLVGPEMRGSSPVRILRDHESRESTGIQGLYPVGEGAGYAGGIVSAAVDGLRSARKIVEQFAPLAHADST